MEQLKVSIVVKVVIIVLNSFIYNCSAQIDDNSIKDYLVFSDSIKLVNTDFEIQANTDNYLRIQIINKEKIREIKKINNPEIILFINNKSNTAKGNNIINSSVPLNCNYFFSIDDNGNIFNIESGNILFYKINSSVSNILIR